MSKLFWILLVVLAGSVLPIQAGLNARLGKEIASPVWAVFVSFVIGAITTLAYILVTRNAVAFESFKLASKWVWLAGAFGAFYVAVVVLALPRLGAALTFGLVVAGQLGLSLILDHFNFLVHQQHSINLFRILGMLLIIMGVVLIRRF